MRTDLTNKDRDAYLYQAVQNIQSILESGGIQTCIIAENPKQAPLLYMNPPRRPIPQGIFHLRDYHSPNEQRPYQVPKAELPWGSLMMFRYTDENFVTVQIREDIDPQTRRENHWSTEPLASRYGIVKAAMKEFAMQTDDKFTIISLPIILLPNYDCINIQKPQASQFLESLKERFVSLKSFLRKPIFDSANQ